jgi:tRNA A-37 threonylcarbamoyl transferase component Bud32
MGLQTKEGIGAADEPGAQTLAVGEVIADKYRIERLLGAGGMAEVYAAINLRTDRRVALKWILPALAASNEVLARFRREALAAGRINHPNVVTIFDVVEHQGSACIVMELLGGETLHERMSRVGQMSFVEAVAIILPAMRGVAAAHAHGVIHRDLKPDNIFLCLDADNSIRDCKVLDFGVSKLTIADAATTGDITLSGNVVGTPEYMAPEQVRSGKGADHRIDIYSLGVVFYEMLAGRPPFVGEHFSGLMLDIMQRDPPPLVGFRADVPRRLASVIHRALERDLEKRYLDMQGFIVALESVGRDELKLAMETPPEGLVTKLALPRLTPALQSEPLSQLRGRRLLGALGAIAVGVAAGGIYLWLQNRPVPDVADRPAPSPTIAPAPAAPEAAKPQAAGVMVKHPEVAVEPTVPAEARAPDATSASRRSGRKRDGRTGGADRDQTKSEAPAAAAAAPTLPQRVTSQPAGRPNRAGKLSVDDF